MIAPPLPRRPASSASRAPRSLLLLVLPKNGPFAFPPATVASFRDARPSSVARRARRSRRSRRANDARFVAVADGAHVLRARVARARRRRGGTSRDGDAMAGTNARDDDDDVRVRRDRSRRWKRERRWTSPRERSGRGGGTEGDGWTRCAKTRRREDATTGDENRCDAMDD
jgi:hypothetical protein